MDHGFGQWVTIHADRYPDRVALLDEHGSRDIGYGELEARTNAIAASLSQRGVRRGDRVALLMQNCIEMLELYLAVAKLGAISVPINWRLAAPEVEYVLADSGACVLVHSDVFAEVARAACTDAVYVRSRRQVTADPDGGPEYRALLEADTDRVTRDISPDEVCVIMYTSGTTGRPKGAMLTHGNFQWNAFHAMTFGNGMGHQDRTITAAPMFHIGALGVHTLPLLYVGGSNVIMRAFEPGAFIDAMERHGVTVAFAVPAMWAAVANHPRLTEADLSRLDFAITGGAPCPIPVIEALQARGMAFTEGFGMTETSPSACYLDHEDVVRKSGSIGKPVAHMEFRIVDEDGAQVGVGEVGELVVRGPNVFSGYWDKPEATAQALRNGWFHTGDLGKVDDDGFYTLVDRKKDMVISGGENVYPVEVEQVLVRHPDVAEVAVVGTPHATWGETVVAIVVRTPGSSLTDVELMEWCEGRIARFKAPRIVEFVDELPRNATGKVLKRELRARYNPSGSVVSR